MFDKNKNEKISVVVSSICKEDLDNIDSESFHFNWSEELNYEVVKLYDPSTLEIFGVLSFEEITSEFRLHLRLLAVRKEHVGKNKSIHRIAGVLIGYLCAEALKKYGGLACVSLKPKSKLAKHYIEKYKMRISGSSLSIEIPELLDLIHEYLKS